MTDLTRFDVDTLRQLAGAKTFERGEEYLEDDLVELLAVEPGRVLARVAGNEDYGSNSGGAARLSKVIAPVPLSWNGASASTWLRSA